ncbi:hypothetical protein ACEWY4_006954 [Coilia grayii]|uniref:ACB domain-containing protein n=1 Tax=Coilia grayii TaxID=363190 RepID=A0ABD1KEY8_9TELE
MDDYIFLDINCTSNRSTHTYREAWKALGDMTKETAMMEYVEKIKLILEILPVSEEVSELLDVLDNFYEFVDDGDLCKSVEFTEDQCVDPTRPIIDVSEWRGGTPVYSGSGEDSSSSLTSDAHSSFNSQDDEDELACSQEPPYQKILGHVNGSLTNDNGVASEQSFQTQAPDDLHCDSSEHPAPKEGAAFPKTPLAKPEESRAKRQSPQGESKAIECGQQGPIVQCGTPTIEEHRTVQPDQSSVQLKDNQRNKTVAMGNINKDIAIALTRLQADMQDVLQRLNTLEALSLSQTKSLALRKEQLINETKRRTSWWPFHLSPVTMSLAIAWPLLVHWIVDFYYQRRRK